MTKLRVYELAKELGVPSKQVMAALQELGEFVRSASSPINPPVTSAVRDKLRRQPIAEEVIRPERHQGRPASAPRDSGWQVRPPGRRVPQRPRGAAVRDLAPLEQVVAKHRGHDARVPGLDVESIKAEARAWATEWFTEKEADRWLTLRMIPANARQCANLGITPELIVLPFQMPGRALAGGTMTYLAAFLRGVVTIPEIHDDLSRVGRLP